MNAMDAKETKGGTKYPIYLDSREHIQAVRDDDSIVKIPVAEKLKSLVVAAGGKEDDIILFDDPESGRMGVIEEKAGQALMKYFADRAVEEGEWTQEDADYYMEHGSDGEASDGKNSKF